MLMSSTWRRYAKGLVRDDLAAPDNGVNVNIEAIFFRVPISPLNALLGIQLLIAVCVGQHERVDTVADPNLI